MMRKIFLSLLAGLHLFTANVGAVEGGAALPDLLAEARRNNPAITAAGHRWEAAAARVPQAKSLPNPEIGFSFEKIPRGTAQINNTAADDRRLTIAQFFPAFGKLSFKGKIAFVESRMAAADYQAVILDTLRDVKAAYYQLYLNQRERLLNQEAMDLIEQVNALAEAQYAAGRMTQGEVYTLHMESARLYTRNRTLERDEQTARVALNLLLNRPPDQPLADPVVPPAEQDPIGLVEDLQAEAVRTQPELQILTLAIEKNRYAKSLAKRGFFPDLLAQLTQRGITTGSLGPWDLMLSFSFPLWFWTKERYQVKEAIADLAEAEAVLTSMTNQTRLRITELTSALATAQDHMRLNRVELLPRIDGNIESALAALRSGNGALIPILSGLRERITARLDYDRALVDYYQARAELDRIIGKNADYSGEDAR